jgi:4-amino-4-deoxy-L-arabinose transferase-like glycosyltransferase
MVDAGTGRMPGAGTAAIAVLLALAPLWIVGILRQTYWTPDEPREADIVWRMSFQQDQSLPQLAGAPILEKPPLYYWIAAGAVRAIGSQPWVVRLPNLLYASVATLAVFLLAYGWVGVTGARMAGITAGSFVLSLQVAIWLATDAALVAAVSVSLLGLYRGLHASPGRQKLAWYLLMHASMALGFMVKSGAALMVPVMTLITLVIWERRLAELRRWELWAGVLLQGAVIVPWIVAIAVGNSGHEHLVAFFWWNLAGRLLPLKAAPGIDFSPGHRNWFGKYFLEAPLYLLPWTFVCVAALRRAWTAVHEPSRLRSAWRFTAAASLPALLLLSVSATARGIYAAPVLPAMGLMVGLWAADRGAQPDEFDLRMTRWTIYLVASLVVLGMAAIPPLSAAAMQAAIPPLRTGAIVVAGSTMAVIALALAWRRLRRGAPRRAIYAVYAANLAWLCAISSASFPAIDQQHDLSSIGRALAGDLEGRTLVLWRPDETTRAFIDMEFGGRDRAVASTDDMAHLVAVLEREPDARVLLQMPGHADGPMSEWLRRYGVRSRTRPSQPVEWADLVERGLVVNNSYDVPDGRRYSLLHFDRGQRAAVDTDDALHVSRVAARKRGRADERAP